MMSAPEDRSDVDDEFFEVVPEEWAWVQRSPARRIYDVCIRAARGWSARSDPTVLSLDVLGVGALVASFLCSASRAAFVRGFGVPHCVNKPRRPPATCARELASPSYGI